MKFPNFYESPYFKYTIVLPILMVAISLFLIPSIGMGIDLAGGTRITVADTGSVDVKAVEQALAPFGLEDLSVKFIENPLTSSKGVIVEYRGNPDILRAERIAATDSNASVALLDPFVVSKADLGDNATADRYLEVAKTDFDSRVQSTLLSFLGASEKQVTRTQIGASLGQEFWDSSLRAMFIAFVLVAAVILILFREIVPSAAVVQSAIFDIVTAAGGMVVFGIPLTLPTIAALLLLVGYSVDTDILITDRVLRRSEGTPEERAFSAILTGLTMTGTTVVAVSVLVAFSYFSQITTIFQIGSVLLIGLFADVLNTWVTNATLVIWWAKRKKK
jgi:preprotein translocase subunit SecF